jgi:hypothetical protein
MPHLSQAVKRDKEALRAVRETLLNDYARRGWMQPVEEVKWRNIGFFQEKGMLKAVVFDMTRVESLGETDGVKWVNECITKLKERK